MYSFAITGPRGNMGHEMLKPSKLTVIGTSTNQISGVGISGATLVVPGPKLLGSEGSWANETRSPSLSSAISA